MTADPRLHTPATVAAALIAGFAALRSAPCWTVGPRLVEGHAPPAAMALNLLPDYVPDMTERKRLLLWVRCQVHGESWRGLCNEAGWSMSSEDKRRARALARIAAALNAVEPVDVGEGGPNLRDCAGN